MTSQECVICARRASITHHLKDLNRTVNCETCGQYDIEGILVDLPQDFQNYEHKYVLSALTRQASDSGRSLVITTENIKELFDSTTIPPIHEKMDWALLYMSKVKERPDNFIHVNVDRDYPLVFARDGREFSYLLELLAERSLFEERGAYPVDQPIPQYRLTPEGWNAVEQTLRSHPDSNQAFVAMWFTDELKLAWELGFKPALESTGFTPIRVDIIEHNRKIDDLIIAEIRRSGLLVADFTGNRGGVYFEAGFALGLGIPVVWTCKDTDIKAVHFDTRQYNHIVWNDPGDLKDKLTNRISATIAGRATR